MSCLETAVLVFVLVSFYNFLSHFQQIVGTNLHWLCKDVGYSTKIPCIYCLPYHFAKYFEQMMLTLGPLTSIFLSSLACKVNVAFIVSMTANSSGELLL